MSIHWPRCLSATQSHQAIKNQRLECMIRCPAYAYAGLQPGNQLGNQEGRGPRISTGTMTLISRWDISAWIGMPRTIADLRATHRWLLIEPLEIVIWLLFLLWTLIESPPWTILQTFMGSSHSWESDLGMTGLNSRGYLVHENRKRCLHALSLNFCPWRKWSRRKLVMWSGPEMKSAG